MWTSNSEIAEITELLEFFSKNTYNSWDLHPKVHHVMQRCLDLFGMDYTYSIISNSNGELSTNYPSSLIFLERDKNHQEAEISKATTPINEDLNSLNLSTPNGDSQHISTSSYDGFHQELPKIKDLCSKARYARCRARFPVPVILFNKKHICRSATLSGGPEIYGRASFDYFFSGNSGAAAAAGGGVSVENKVPEASETAEEDVIVPDTEGQGDWQLFDRVRNQDIRLLKTFQVQNIVDLMVEKKKVKFGVNVTSSEKVDKKNRYAEFNLMSLPYPGCEFFKQYRDNGYSGEELMFEWNQGHVDANIYVPSDETTDSLNLEWSQYRKWDLVQLTQNYLKLLLAYLKGNNSGMLIHCISGWDRTPLFICLLRLSLWADGAIHQSLSAEQILYLTLAYDWLLFGHNLEDRLHKGEEILYFCFYFLTHMVDEEFSIDYDVKHCQTTSSKHQINIKTSQPENHSNTPPPRDMCTDTDNDDVAKENHANIEDSCQGGVNSCNGVSQDHPIDEHTTTTPSSASPSVVNHDDCNGAQYPMMNGLSSETEVSSHSNAHCQNHQLNHQPNNEFNHQVDNELNHQADNELNHQADNELNHQADNELNHQSDHQSDLKSDFDASENNCSQSNPKCNGNVDHSNSNGVDESLDTPPVSVPITKRSERLQLVRSHFYAIYDELFLSTATQSQARQGVNENTSGSGLSVIIDNIATKVGIRAPSRSTS